jgi:hypothetical protein
MSIDRYSEAPRLKGIAGFDNNELVSYRDTQDVTTENLVSGSTFPFFPSQAEGTEADSNYISNPLTRNRAYDVVGLGFAFTARVLETTSATPPIDLAALFASIEHARVRFQTGQQRELLDRHLVEFCAFEEARYYKSGDTVQLVLPTSQLLRSADPIHLSPQETWDLEVIMEDPSGIPGESDYGTLGQGTLGMIATIGVAFDE